MTSMISLAVLVALFLICGGILGFIAMFKLRNTDERLDKLRQAVSEQSREIMNLQAAISKHYSTPDSPEEIPKPVDEPVDKPVQRPVDSTGGKYVEEFVDKPVDDQAQQEFIPRGIPVYDMKSTEPAASVLGEESKPFFNLEWIEENIGKRWMTWAGAVILIFATGFFLKYAFDNDWIGPSARIIMGVVFGIALIGSGDNSIRRKMRILGQGLIGGGLAVLYMSIFAAFSFYDLIHRDYAFILLILVTASGVAMAIMHNAKVIAILATLGGLLTPVMISTGKANRDALMAYIVMLDLGVMAVAFFRKWRALDILAFAGTTMLFTAWYEKYYRLADQMPTIFWLSAIYLIFLLLPFIHHLRKETPIAVERFIMSIANAAFYFGFAYVILKGDHRHVLGFIALGMSASYIVMGTITRRRLTTDANSLFSFVTMSVALLTLAIPLHLKMHGITLMWAVEGPVLIYLGYRFRYLPTRIFGLIVLCFATARIFTSHWPLHVEQFTPILNKSFAGAIFVSAMIFASGYIHRRFEKRSSKFDEPIITGLPLVAGFLAIILFHFEFGDWFRRYYLESGSRYLSQCVVIAIWAIGALAYLHIGKYTKNRVGQLLGIIPLMISILLALAAYLDSPGFDFRLFVNYRFIASFLAVLILLDYAIVAYQGKNEQSPRNEFAFRLAAGVFMAVLLLFLSIEVYVFSHTHASNYNAANWSGLMGLSIVWGSYAAAMLALGFWKRVRALRLAALALFGVTALKLIFVDMSAIGQIYRIISFFVIGGLMIAAAYLYNKLEKRLGNETTGIKT